jgi:hypothetical protein
MEWTGARYADKPTVELAIDAMPDEEQKIVFVRLREFENAMTATLAAIKRLAEDGGR